LTKSNSTTDAAGRQRSGNSKTRGARTPRSSSAGVTTLRTNVRDLRAVDEAALDATHMLRLPCLIVESRPTGTVARGDTEWAAPEQANGVGRAGWNWDGEQLHAHTGPYGFRPLFVRRLADGVALSPSLVRLMSMGGPLPIDDRAMAVFLRRPGTATRRNVFSEWFYIDNGKIRTIYSAMFYPTSEVPVPNWPPYDGNWPLPAALAPPAAPVPAK